MRRPKRLALLVCAFAAVCFWGPTEAPGGRHRGVCVQPCVVQFCPAPCLPYPPPWIICPPSKPDPEKKRDADSKKVNFLFILDTEDDKIGKDVMIEAKRLEVLLWSSLPRELRGQTDFVVGKQLKSSEVTTAINALDVGPNETLFVYCNLHGRGQEGSEDQILQMQGGPDAGLPRKTLWDQLLQKKAFLTVLITDSCFKEFNPSRQPGSDDFDIVTKVKPVEEGESLFTDLAAANLTDLLVNHKGAVNINSCAKGEVALSRVFTPAFIDRCKGWAPPDGAAAWEQFFPELQKQTKKNCEDLLAKAAEKPKEMKDQNTQTATTFGTLAKPDLEFIRDRAKLVAPAAPDVPPTPPAVPPPATPEGEREANAATLTVRVPAQAKLFFDGTPTRQTTPVRVFTTPPLKPGRDFFYTLRAEMATGRETLTETKRVKVRAGAETAVSFDDLLARAPAAPPESAEVTVRLPGGARLFVDEKAHPEEGTVRVIHTPPLAKDRAYTLHLRVEVNRGEKTETLERRIDLEPGKKVEVDFTDPKTAKKPPAP